MAREFHQTELYQRKQGSRLKAHPEGAVGDADASPGHHGRVLHRLPGHVGTAISAVAVVLDRCLHGAALIVLQNGQEQVAFWSVPRSGHLPSLLPTQGAPHLDLDLERSLPAVLGIHCELCRLVHGHTSLLQSRPTCLHLMGGHPVLRAQSAGPLRPSHPAAHALYPVWMEILGCVADVSHEGAETDVLTIAQHVHCVLASLLWPVAHIAGTITLVITFDLGL